jgi:[ribosomal protein S5]-alanine N-acetyltransferase
MEILSTPRLIMRAVREEDIVPLHTCIFSIQEVMRHAMSGKVLSLAQATDYIHEKFNFSAASTGLSTLVERQDNAVIGFAGLLPCRALGQDDLEFGFVLAQAAWGKGYATEIGKRQISFGLTELKRSRMLALASPDNTASIHAITKLGLQHVRDLIDPERGSRSVFCIEKAPGLN